MSTDRHQIILIHGASSFSNYETFLGHLRTRPIEDPLGLSVRKRWKDGFKAVLSEVGEVYFPQMPNSDNARYAEWKIWFERYLDFVRGDVVLIGHSQGGYFLAKYLSENRVPVSVRALYLLAAPFEPADFHGEDGGDFAFDPARLVHLEEQVGSVYIFHSTDDPIVPYAHAEKYQQALKNADLQPFSDKGHFILEDFPELIAHVQSIMGNGGASIHLKEVGI